MKPFLILTGLILLVGCTEIAFKEPQPKNVKALKSFPSSVRGLYIIPEDSLNKTFDTLAIEKQWYRITGDSGKNDWGSKGYLNDSLVLKNYKGFYFLNFKVDNQWVIRVFRNNKNGAIVLYEINLSDEKVLAQMKAQLHPEEIKIDSDTYYRVDLTAGELLDFIKQNYKAQTPIQKIQ